MSESNSPSPLITLWYKPGQTLQGLIENGAGHRVALIVAALFGFVQAWPHFVSRESDNPGTLIVGMLAGLLGVYFFGWLLRNFGRWFGSEAEQVQVRTALGWGLLPTSILLALLILCITVVSVGPQMIFPVFFGVILYGFVILLSALSAALRISFMKTFFCLILTFLVSIFPITLIMQLLMGAPTPAP